MNNKRLKLSTKDKILLCKRLGLFLQSGLALSPSLHIIYQERSHKNLRHILGHAISTVEQGQPLSQSMMQFPRTFSAFVIHVVKIGESTGSLATNFNYIAGELEQRRILHRKILTALIYPSIVIVCTAFILGILTFYIFPKITPVFNNFKATLPWNTKLLLSMTALLIHHAWWWAGLAGLALGGLSIVHHLPTAKKFRDQIVLAIPGLRQLVKTYILANFCRTLSQLLNSQIPIMKALSIVRSTTTHTMYKNQITALSLAVNHGQSFAQFFATQPRLFPSVMSQLIAAGEQTGTLSENFLYLARLYEQDLADATAQIAVIVEPALIIIIGGIVGFVAISIITPIYQLTQSLHG